MATSFQLNSLIRPNILMLSPYSSARLEHQAENALMLDANENPFPSPYNRYPDPRMTTLKQRVAQIKGIAIENIYLGNGSDEPIDLLIRMVCHPGKDMILMNDPSYGVYPVAAQINDIKVIKIPLGPDFSFPLEDMLSQINNNLLKIIFICSPNNPTGNAFEPDEILKICQNFNGIVVVDEAYIDFSSKYSMIRHLDDNPNLVVLQTFSKAWGLAGLRLGSCFASREIIEWLDKIRAPYNVSGPTQIFALKALNSGELEMKKQSGILLSERNRLSDLLQSLPEVKKVYPSDANFLLARFENATNLYRFLIHKNILIRDRTMEINCENCLRITVGTNEENNLLFDTIKSFYSK